MKTLLQTDPDRSLVENQIQGEQLTEPETNVELHFEHDIFYADSLLLYTNPANPQASRLELDRDYVLTRPDTIASDMSRCPCYRSITFITAHPLVLADYHVYGDLITPEAINIAREEAAEALATLQEHAETVTAGVHGATTAAVPGRIVIRDVRGSTKFAVPEEPDDAARLAEITQEAEARQLADSALADSVATAALALMNAIDAHAALLGENAHGATPDPDPESLIARDINGNSKVAAPTDPEHIARKAEVDAALAAALQAIANLVDSSPEALNTLNELAAALGDDPNFATTIINALALKAPLASPEFTGAPTAPTPAMEDASTKIATTEFVAAAVAAGGGDEGLAPLESPAFTGIPTAPTPAPEDASTKIATTEFVAAGFPIIEVLTESKTYGVLAKDYRVVVDSATESAIDIQAGAAVGNRFFFCNRGSGAASLALSASVSRVFAQGDIAEFIWTGLQWMDLNDQAGGWQLPTEIRITNGSGNWIVPDGVTKIRVKAIGGGGGGGGGGNSGSNSSGAGGGGGGGTEIVVAPWNVLTVTPGAAITYSIGTGGLGGTVPGGAGGNGNPTTFGEITAQGGSGGTGGGSGGGAGGSGGLGIDGIGSGGGASAGASVLNVGSSAGGHGGGSGGSGGAAGIITGNGKVGMAGGYGGGGGGGSGGKANSIGGVGGNGGSGLIIIEY